MVQAFFFPRLWRYQLRSVSTEVSPARIGQDVTPALYFRSVFTGVRIDARYLVDAVQAIEFTRMLAHVGDPLRVGVAMGPRLICGDLLLFGVIVFVSDRVAVECSFPFFPRFRFGGIRPDENQLVPSASPVAETVHLDVIPFAP